jgi:hypothetical protein
MFGERASTVPGVPRVPGVCPPLISQSLRNFKTFSAFRRNLILLVGSKIQIINHLNGFANVKPWLGFKRPSPMFHSRSVVRLATGTEGSSVENDAASPLLVPLESVTPARDEGGSESKTLPAP